VIVSILFFDDTNIVCFLRHTNDKKRLLLNENIRLVMKAYERKYYKTLFSNFLLIYKIS